MLVHRLSHARKIGMAVIVSREDAALSNLRPPSADVAFNVGVFVARIEEDEIKRVIAEASRCGEAIGRDHMHAFGEPMRLTKPREILHGGGRPVETVHGEDFDGLAAVFGFHREKEKRSTLVNAYLHHDDRTRGDFQFPRTLFTLRHASHRFAVELFKVEPAFNFLIKVLHA